MDSEKDCKEKAFKTVIVTRNAYHGGVETLIKLESYGIKAPVIVAGALMIQQKRVHLPILMYRPMKN